MFEHFPNGQYSLPHRVKLTLTAGGQPMEMLIDVGDWVVNQLLTNDPNQFSMPESSSDRKIDVSSPATAAIPVSPSASGYVAADPTGLPLRGTERR